MACLARVGVFVVAFVAISQAFYLPGVAPEDYKKEASIEVKAERLNSIKTQLPFEYYSLPFCQPDEIDSETLNLGEIFHGSRVLNTAYKFSILKDTTCKIVCAKSYDTETMDTFMDLIDDDYRVSMLLDNLPLMMPHVSEEETEIRTYDLGYPVGELHHGHDEEAEKEPTITLNNHLKFTILYNTEDAEVGVRIVGFEVEPASVRHEIPKPFPEFAKTCANKDSTGDCELKTCKGGEGLASIHEPLLIKSADDQVVWTYDVLWKRSEVKWASRWDAYLQMQDEQVHWFSIVNSFMIVLFLSGLVAMILLRALKNDFDRYESMNTHEDPAEETGWKLVHGDVFRPPQFPMFLSVFIGTGSQLCFMTVVVMGFAILGFLSPANRGSLLSTTLFLFMFMGIFGGYNASRLYKMFKGQAWKRLTLLTALLFPGSVFSVFFFLNILVWAKKSSAAVPFGTLVALLFMWFGISAPLVFLGSYFGFKKNAIEHPVRTNQIPRTVPKQPWYMHPVLTILMGGVLPFGAVFVELFFILTSVWRHQFYYLFGFLFLVIAILALTCAEITVVMCYFQLCTEDYHWWWRSFLTSGSCAVYLFAYSFLYFVTQLQVTKFASAMLFFGYMLMCSFTFFVITGTVGFFSAFYFVRKIYASIKVD